MRISAIGYGATFTDVTFPDRGGTAANVTLGHETLEEYQSNTEFFGCIVGRFANRIAGGRFSLDGKAYDLARNDGALYPWRAARIRQGGLGEEGYPGTL